MKKRILIIVWCAIVYMFLPDAAPAANEQTPLNFKNSNPIYQARVSDTRGEELALGNTPTISALSLFGKVIFVLFLIIIFFYIVRRFFAKKNIVAGMDNDLFKTLAVYTIGPGKTLHLIEMGRSVLVIGVTEHTLSLIKEITEPENIDTIKLYASALAEDAGKLSFLDYLKEILPLGGRTSGNRKSIARYLDQMGTMESEQDSNAI